MNRKSSVFLSLIFSLILALSGVAQDGKDRNRGRDQKPDEGKKKEVIQEKPKNDRDKKDNDRGSNDRRKNGYY